MRIFFLTLFVTVAELYPATNNSDSRRTTSGKTRGAKRRRAKTCEHRERRDVKVVFSFVSRFSYLLNRVTPDSYCI